VMGTPRYIAPERLARRPADARADQFAFAVMLGDALEPARAGVAVRGKAPRWLERCLVRARSTDPADRFPSMEALIAEIRRRRRLGARLWLGLGAVALVAAALLVGRQAAERATTCDGGGARLAGVWDDAVAAQVKDVMNGTKRAYAANVYATVSGRLGRYRSDWIAMHKQACEASASGVQSGVLLDRRMACLERRRTNLRQVSIVLRRAADIGKATEVVDGLPPVAACGDAETLLAVVPLPDDPKRRAAVAELERAAASAEVEQAAGHIDVALRLARETLPKATEVGHAPLQARVGMALGRTLFDSGRPADAEATLWSALAAAVAGRDEGMTVMIETELVAVIGLGLHRLAEAQVIGRLAIAALTRVGPAVEPLLRARLLVRLGAVAMEHSDFAQAEQLMTEGRGLMRVHLAATDRRLANAEDLLAINMVRWGKREEALNHALASLDIVERAVGPNHPQVADVLNNLGAIYESLNRQDDRRAAYLRALAIVEKLPEYHSTPTLLNNLGNLEASAGHLELAIQYHEKALLLRKDTLGPTHVDVASSLLSLGLDYADAGDFAKALPLQQQALAIREAALGPKDPRVAKVLTAIGETLCNLGRANEALPVHRRAVAILEEKFGHDHRDVRSARAIAALALVALGHGHEAIEPLQKGLADLDPDDQGRVDLLFGLAHALPKKDRARASAREARTLLGKLRPTVGAEIDRWLAAHRK
jgi:eukaryotic-like serine/threonine-protein kinase